MIENRLKNNHTIPLEYEGLGIYLNENSGKPYLGGMGGGLWHQRHFSREKTP